MAPEAASITLEPVAVVRNGIAGPKHEGWAEVVSDIIFLPEHAARLEGIEGFSHIQVLFYLHLTPPEERARQRFRPRDNPDLPMVGAFATRSQRRPNPIGLSTVRLLRRRGRALVVQGLDALDGTPVLDIKPYTPRYERPEGEVRVPEWAAWQPDASQSPPGQGLSSASDVCQDR